MDLRKKRALDRSAAVAAAIRERIVEQLDFADGLCELHPDRAAEWKPLIADARERLARWADTADVAKLCPLAGDIEKHLAPIGAVAKTYTLHCAGHAHIDMNWMWAWPETVAVVNDSFLTVLALMDEFPDFTLTQSMGAIYDIARRYNPELFERMKQRIAEGRWEVTAAAWVEADKNLSSGESLARHLLYTRQFTTEHFGLDADKQPIQWEPDTFGHAHTIPSIVSRGGIKYYYCCRPGETPTPAVFWFQGPDGARVLVNRETAWYNNVIAPHSTKKLLAFCKETGLRDWLHVYGVGDHGGGPTRRDLRRRAELDSWPIFPNFRFSTTKPFFELLEKHGERWPTLDRELNFEFAGCYTSQSAIKKINRFGENLMMEAEIAATLAHRAVGRAYPSDQLKASWMDVLFGQFHDILPGSGVPATRQFAQASFQNIQANTGMVKTHSLRALAAKIDTSFARTESDGVPAADHENRAFGAGAGRITTIPKVDGSWRLTENQQVSSASHVVDGPRPVVVFNTLAWKRSDVLTVSVWDGDAAYQPVRMRDRRFVARMPDGTILPTQVVQDGDFWDHQFVDLAVPIAVGPMAYSSLAIEEIDPADAPPPPAGVANVVIDRHTGWGFNLAHGRMGLENEHLLVELDRTTGGIVKLLDKSTGEDLACPGDPMGLLEYVVERPVSMNAWVIGDERSRVFPLDVESLRPTAEGPWIAAITATVKINDSKFDVTYSLRADLRRLEIEIAGQWFERGGPEVGIPRLSIRLPLNMDDPKARYEIPFGSIERNQTNGREMPALRWVDVRDGAGAGKGLCLVNDSKYGHSLTGSVLRQTLIRSSYDPDPLPEIGEHRIRLALAPHDGNAKPSELIQWGTAFNHAMICVNTDAHDGPLPATLAGVASCDGAGAILTHLKVAEDGDGLVARLLECDGAETTATIALDSTILGKVASAARVDLLERPADGAAAIVDGAVTVTLRPHEIASVRLRAK